MKTPHPIVLIAAAAIASGCVSGSIFKPHFGDRALSPHVQRAASSDTVEVSTAEAAYAALVLFAPDGHRAVVSAAGAATRHTLVVPERQVDQGTVHRASRSAAGGFPRVSQTSCGWVYEREGVDANGKTVYRRVPRCVQIPSPGSSRLTERGGGPSTPFAIAVTSQIPLDEDELAAVARTIGVHSTPYQAASALARGAFRGARTRWSLAVVR